MRNFLKICITTIFLSVIFLLGILNVNALTIYDDNNVAIALPDLPSPPNSNFTKYAIAKEKNNVGGHYVLFYVYNDRNCYFNENVFSNPNLNYYSFGCNSSSSTNQMRYYYMQNNSWILQGYTNTYGSLLSNPFATSFNVYTDNTYTDIGYNANYGLSLPVFSTDYEQGEVIIANSGGSIANLITYYVEPNFDYTSISDYNFSYILNSNGGARESIVFNLSYNENGISYNNKIYHYYFNLPLSYNTDLTFSIRDLENNLIKEDYITAYLSSLSSLSNYTMYDFRNYEYANMSDINSGDFGISRQLNSNITINAVNYNTNSKVDFLTSSYYISSTTDNAGITWYNFNFNNEPIYLEFINNFNNDTDFYTYIDTYNLYFYFDNTAYIHLSGSPNSLNSQDNIVNQQSYKNENGDIIYNNNPIVIDVDNSSEFFQNFQKYFKDFDNDTFGLTGIITSPLNLIQNLLTDTCNPLVVPLPYVNSNLTLPCMSSIYSQYFGGFYIIYQDITFGIVAYWIIVRILNLVKDFRNPEHDEIEVLDL